LGLKRVVTGGGGQIGFYRIAELGICVKYPKTVSIYTKIPPFLAIFGQFLGKFFSHLSRCKIMSQTPPHKKSQKTAIFDKKCDGGW